MTTPHSLSPLDSVLGDQAVRMFLTRYRDAFLEATPTQLEAARAAMAAAVPDADAEVERQAPGRPRQEALEAAIARVAAIGAEALRNTNPPESIRLASIAGSAFMTPRSTSTHGETP